jgi:hypothetical protein
MKGTHIQLFELNPKAKAPTWNGAVRGMTLECMLARRTLLYRNMMIECVLLCKLSGSWVGNRRLSYENAWSRYVPPPKTRCTDPL